MAFGVASIYVELKLKFSSRW